MKISFVLLIKIRSHHSHNELERLKSIQLKSFRKFLDISILKDFYIVASREDIQIIKADLLKDYPEFPFVFVDEEALCPSLTGASGWTKQMIFKIAVANMIETDYYLTLDTDVFLTKALSGGDILRNGRLTFQKENPDTHVQWWKSSCRVLHVDPDMLLKNKFVMGVTPEYLVTDVCRRLQHEIERLHCTKDFASWLISRRMSKKNLLNKIIKKLSETVPIINEVVPQERMDQITTCDWTEYTLYWVYLNKYQLVDKYYDDNGRQIYGGCIWGKKDIRNNDLQALVEKAFTDNDDYHFSIFQSSIKELDQINLAKTIGNYLD
ncbi:MAG: DUF6492 family protein [Desulfuromonadaceae bacterium]